jgi:MarR family transcriptional regulator, organic hydroperoxide resistance regulator
VALMRGDVILKRGFGALGCRLRRLSERLDRDLRDVYQSHGVYFDPAWFPVVAALGDHGPMSLAEIAECTGLAASSIGAHRGRMVSEGLVQLEQDPRDLRRQRLSLTPKGQAVAASLERLWAAIGTAAQALCAETAPDILNDLEVLEKALSRRRMPARVKSILERPIVR